MKKYILGIFSIIATLFFVNNVYALTENFKFVIDTVGIPRYNSYGQEINEDVYYTYNIFSYGKPESTTHKEQRWKNSKYGFWTKSGGSYKGKGTRGEYYILGKSYSGQVIYNYYFPMDVIPSTTPDKWTFYKYPGAAESWKDKTKYKYTEQLTHMKTSKLMFNDISSRSKADNPKYIKEYNITANKIGLSKARLDVAATWKTYGMISTRRYINGVIYSQVYLVKPMAANAKVKTNLTVQDNYVLKETEDEISIPITYLAEVLNMEGYAKKEHIKNLTASLYINGEKVDSVSGSKIVSVGNEYLLTITRNNYPPNQNHSVEITVDSYMHTEFAVDGLMQDKISKTINIYVEPKLIIPVKETALKVVEKEALDWVVRPLAQSITDSKDTLGFTEAGKHLIAKIDLNVKLKEIKDVIVYIDDKKIEDVLLYDLENILAVKLQIPDTISPTLYGEESLRKTYGNYFSIDKNNIGKRIDNPHTLKVEFEFGNKKYEEIFNFDTLDRFISNVNSKVSNTNLYDGGEMLDEWLNAKG